MNQQNERMLLAKRVCVTPIYILTKENKSAEKNHKTSSFWFSSCFTLTYSKKFNSGDVVTEKKPFWSPLYYLLINVHNRKSWKNLNFQKLVFELPVPFALGDCASK
jgi:hypothetical protein